MPEDDQQGSAYDPLCYAFNIYRFHVGNAYADERVYNRRAF